MGEVAVGEEEGVVEDVVEEAEVEGAVEATLSKRKLPINILASSRLPGENFIRSDA